EPRNNTVVGEWWGSNWFCSSCTIPDELHDLPLIDTHAHVEFILDGRRGCDVPDEELQRSLFGLALSGPFAVITSCCDAAAIEDTV
ncbi:unnamed protein product, partial [Amoebophrya sp. A120]